MNVHVHMCTYENINHTVFFYALEYVKLEIYTYLYQSHPVRFCGHCGRERRCQGTVHVEKQRKHGEGERRLRKAWNSEPSVLIGIVRTTTTNQSSLFLFLFCFPLPNSIYTLWYPTINCFLLPTSSDPLTLAWTCFIRCC